MQHFQCFCNFVLQLVVILLHVLVQFRCTYRLGLQVYLIFSLLQVYFHPLYRFGPRHHRHHYFHP